MRGGLFLVLYTFTNAALLSTCAIYVAYTKGDSFGDERKEDDALVIPQILTVIPGTD